MLQRGFNIHKRLSQISQGPFYQHYVKLPTLETPLSAIIQDNPKFFPFFQNVIGAIDGTHINAHTSALERHINQDQKGGITQNCLFACDMEFRFIYGLTGFEGSAADSSIYHHTRLLDFTIPPGKHYLADAGFPACDALLVPYRGVRYHLAEWGRAGIRPANKEELYNLRHAQLRNIVERIFGVVKKWWSILDRPLEFDMDIQVRIPSGLIAVHNFILEYDGCNLQHYLDMPELGSYGRPSSQTGPVGQDAFGQGSIPRLEYNCAVAYRNQIAGQMWEQYQQFLHDHPKVLDQEFDPEEI
ncbi:hypothetical protein EST38_g14334 [Candolleomyces aberdarensis]|uniref:DDE Tnp4 domain-containing protein n=1 Tax=Candolleomyces aberdarensis TaxID=2316362 RepID=A0A4Q2CYQ1_9AGAR|nr:hypothetical protein EST38_g14334 [Candolleomyces aberdarensis]